MKCFVGAVLVALASVCVAITTDPLLHYQFRESDTIYNTGLRFNDPSNLVWHGGPRDVINGVSSVSMNPLALYYYQSEMPIEGLQSAFMLSQGFEVMVRFHPQLPNFYRAQFCLFCLLSATKNTTTLQKFDPCKDMDFGVVLKGRVVSIITRNSESEKCNHLELAATLPDNTKGSSIEVVFRFDNGNRVIYINGREAAHYTPRIEGQDISTWSSLHQLLVGTIKPTMFRTSIQLFEATLSALNRSPPSTNTDGPLIEAYPDTREVPGGSQIRQSPMTRLFSSSRTPIMGVVKSRLEMLHHPKTRSYSPCAALGSIGRCQSPAVNCDVRQQAAPLYKYNIPADILQLKYEILVNASSYTGTDPKGFTGSISCKNNKPLEPLEWKLERYDASACPSAQRSMLVSLSDLYECFTGLPASLITPETLQTQLSELNGLLSVKLGHPECPQSLHEAQCALTFANQLNLRTNGPIKNSGKDVILGGVFTSYGEHTRRILHTRLLPTYIRNEDVYQPLETCILPVLGANTSQSLQKLDLMYSNSVGLELGGVSQCILDPATRVCCYEWSLQTTKRQLSKWTRFRSEVSVGFVMSEDGRSGHIQNFLFAFTELTAAAETTGVHVAHRRAPSGQTRVEICQYNNARLTVPYRAFVPHQTVYFSLTLVPANTARGSTCGRTPRCEYKDITLQLQTLKMCVLGSHPYLKDHTCTEMGGDEQKIADFTDPLHHVYNQAWKPEIHSLYSNCSSIITGSFWEREKRAGYLTVDSDEIDTPLVHPHRFGGNAQKRLNSYQTTSKARRTWTTYVLVGGAPDGFVLDDTFWPNTYVTYFWHYLGCAWFYGRFFLIVPVVGILLTLLIFFFNRVWPNLTGASMSHDVIEIIEEEPEGVAQGEPEITNIECESPQTSTVRRHHRNSSSEDSSSDSD